MFPLRDDQPVFSTPFVTYFLIAINLLIYFVEWQIGIQSRGQLNALLTQFGVVPRLEIRIAHGNSGLQIQRPLCCPSSPRCFCTALSLHVLGNMWMLWIFGDNIEDYLGHFAYLVFYLLSGVAASTHAHHVSTPALAHAKHRRKRAPSQVSWARTSFSIPRRAC